MPAFPRLALGVHGCDTRGMELVGAFLISLRRAGLQPQCFLTRAEFRGFRELAAFSGTRPRHLDRWLMSAEQAVQAIIRGMQGADVAVVVSSPPGPGNHWDCKSQVDPALLALARELGLPLVVALAISDLCTLPTQPFPAETAGLLAAADISDVPVELVTELEARFGVPVLGVLAAQGRAARTASAKRTPRWAYWNAHQMWRTCLGCSPIEQRGTCDSLRTIGRKRTIAIACDEAFFCYYPQTLDSLVRQGARIVDFSPLRSESLPPGTDVVYFGCGVIEDYLPRLAMNHCLIASLRRHVRAGKPIYAEGAGAAWLCQDVQLQNGRRISGASILPATAHRAMKPEPPAPITLTIERPTWLGRRGEVIRGYRNPKWWFEPIDLGTSLIRENGFQYEWIGAGNIVGSTIHCDFSLHPHFLTRFFGSSAGQAVEAKRR
ncbi:cobyrinate a,c-diamide synthase [Thermostilla marina]